MTKLSNSLVVTGIIILIGFLFINYASAPPNGFTNAPFNGFCTECHSSSSALNGTVSMSGIPSEVLPGELYQVRLKVKSTTGTPVTSGFEAVAVYSNTNLNAGDFISTSADVGTSTSSGREYIGHRGPKQFTGDSVSWTFNWQAPQNPSGNAITVYFAANITNGNNRDNGDHPVSGSLGFSIMPQLQPLVAGIQSQMDVSCSGLSDGSATVMASGGSPPYSYQWSNNNAGSMATNLGAGNYQVTVSDNAGGSITVDVAILEPDPLNAMVTAVNPTCDNTSNGNLSAAVSGGTLPYHYQWSEGSSTATINGLSSGSYKLTITDANSCLLTADAMLTASDLQAPTLVVHDITLYPDQNGSIDFSVADAIDLVEDNCSLDSVWAELAAPLSCSTDEVSGLIMARDGSGNLTQSALQIAIMDTIAPIMICPGSIASNEPEVQFTDPTASDNCQLEIVAQVSGPASGSLFPEGISTIVYVASDQAGNTSSCSFTVEVQSSTTARPNYLSNNIRIYPNPFQQNLSIALRQDDFGEAVLILYDLQSRVAGVHKVRIPADHVIHWSDLAIPEGIYLLEVQIGADKIFRKVVKMQ